MIKLDDGITMKPDVAEQKELMTEGCAKREGYREKKRERESYQ